MSASVDFEELLSDTIRRVGEVGPSAIVDACRAHPEMAARLREHLARLSSLGLFDTSADAPLPERVGAYEILGRLGRGGMGVVYLARDPRDGSRVALKTGPVPIERGERSTARFEREMRAFAGLRHENLVRVLDVGSDDGRPFYVMEYVRGATLSEILDGVRAERLAPSAIDVSLLASTVRRIVRDVGARTDAGSARARDSELDDGLTGANDTSHNASDSTDGTFGRTWIEFACRAVLDVARALEHVHEHGIVHRDVKPANVIVRGDGRALLFDLGLAHVDDAPNITGTGDFAGTPHYVSPEVARGDVRAADARSDVFSLGVTLYELCTLRKPFDGATSQQVLRAIVDREPTPPRRVDASLPRDLETICLVALEKDPRRRYASMSEFRADLERFLSFRPVLAQPIGPVRRRLRFARRRPATAAAIALTALVVVAVPTGLYVANRAISGERDRAELAATEARRQSRTSTRVTEFLVELFRAPAGRAIGIGAAEMLERGARRAESDFDDQPLVRAALLEALGVVHANAGSADEAIPLFDRALSIRQRALGEAHADTARVLRELGELQLARGDAPAARSLLERALRSLAASTFVPIGDEARTRGVLGEALLASGDARAAIPHLDAAAAAMRVKDFGTSATLARALENSGRARLAAGDLAGARANLEESSSILRQAFVPELAARARVLALLADVSERDGRVSESVPLRAEALLLGERPSSRAARERPTTSTAWSASDSQALAIAFEPPWRREWESSFQAGITALQSGNSRMAEASFRRCLELRPFDAVCAYNLACNSALLGDVDAGVEWLRRAADMDAGRSPALIAVIDSDAETARLRSDPRGAAIVARMHRDADEPDGPAFEFVPDTPAPAAGRALIVLLRDGTTTNEASEADERWKRIAAETDSVLLRPVAHWRTAPKTDANAPRVWVDALPDFAKRPWAYEAPIVDAVRAVCERSAVDRDRVVLVGVESGALVAFDLAMRAPGLFRGVMLVDGPVHASLSVDSACAAAAAGSSVRAVVTSARRDHERSGTAGRASAPDVAALLARFLDHCGFGADTVRVETALDDAGAQERLRATLVELTTSVR